MAKKTILVVDDEKSIRLVLGIVLEDAGYRPVTAASGKEGLRILKKEKVDLVILDMFMPKMSGREFLETVRKDSELKDTKVIFLTLAKFSERGKREIERLKVADYVTKPFDKKDILKRIKKVIGE